jgi:large subunit ribosomal protein L1
MWKEITFPTNRHHLEVTKMGKQGKKLREAYTKIDVEKQYEMPEAIALAKQLSYVKFDETVEVALKLGVNPKHADQNVRSTVILPHGTGKTVRVVVFAEGEKAAEAEAAGADAVGSEELVQRIQKGWLDFDAAVATPDMMKYVGRIGRVLGPRGLMPNPKLGTVTFEVTKAVNELKAGKIEFRVDKNGILHIPIGKVSFDDKQLLENFMAFYDAVNRVRPATAKGAYMRGLALTTSMGPGLTIDLNSLRK